jgi:hypothetical protein
MDSNCRIDQKRIENDEMREEEDWRNKKSN